MCVLWLYMPSWGVTMGQAILSQTPRWVRYRSSFLVSSGWIPKWIVIVWVHKFYGINLHFYFSFPFSSRKPAWWHFPVNNWKLTPSRGSCRDLQLGLSWAEGGSGPSSEMLIIWVILTVSFPLTGRRLWRWSPGPQPFLHGPRWFALSLGCPRRRGAVWRRALSGQPPEAALFCALPRYVILNCWECLSWWVLHLFSIICFFYKRSHQNRSF